MGAVEQVQRISELEMLAADDTSRPAAEKEIVRLRSMLASKEDQVRSLEKQLASSQGTSLYAPYNFVTVPTHTSVVTTPVGASPSNLPISTTPPPLTTIQQPYMVQTGHWASPSNLGTNSEFPGRASPTFNKNFADAGQGGVPYNVRNIHGTPPTSHSVPATPLGNNFWGSDLPSPFPSGASSPFLKPQPVPQIPGRAEANF